MESDRPEFKFCLCHFLGVGPGTSCLIFLCLFPSLLLRLIIYTLGQLAQGGPAGVAKPAMTLQGHGKPSAGPFWTRYGFYSGLLGGLRCLYIVGALQTATILSPSISPCPVALPRRPLARDEVNQHELGQNISGGLLQTRQRPAGGQGRRSCQQMSMALSPSWQPRGAFPFQVQTWPSFADPQGG